MRTLTTYSAEEAAAFVRAGETVAFPTETVYGLGADALNPVAVARIFLAKGRPADNPLIVHIAAPAAVIPLVSHVPPMAERLMEAFFPGPLTLVLRRSALVPDVVAAGLDTVGVRMPAHDLALEFLRACGTPVAAPSANRSGRPSPTTWQAVRDDLDGRIACILQGEPTHVGLESTVVDCTTEHPILLRAGAITLEALKAVVPGTRAAEPHDALAGRSPGTRHRHYAPHIPVWLVDSPVEVPPTGTAAYIGPGPEKPENALMVALCADEKEYARRLFAFLRQAEQQGAAAVYCRRVPATGLGRALMDRLTRASEGSR